jgi:hypothetical protein
LNYQLLHIKIRYKLKTIKHSLQIDAIIAANYKGDIKAISITIATTIDNVILVLYTRNPTAAYKSIRRRNKRQKRPDLRPGILVDLITNRLTLASALIKAISNILLVLRVILTTITT